MVQGLRAGTPMGSPENREWNCSHPRTASYIVPRYQVHREESSALTLMDRVAVLEHDSKYALSRSSYRGFANPPIENAVRRQPSSLLLGSRLGCCALSPCLSTSTIENLTAKETCKNFRVYTCQLQTIYAQHQLKPTGTIFISMLAALVTLRL